MAANRSPPATPVTRWPSLSLRVVFTAVLFAAFLLLVEAALWAWPAAIGQRAGPPAPLRPGAQAVAPRRW